MEVTAKSQDNLVPDHPDPIRTPPNHHYQQSEFRQIADYLRQPFDGSAVMERPVHRASEIGYHRQELQDQQIHAVNKILDRHNVVLICPETGWYSSPAEVGPQELFDK